MSEGNKLMELTTLVQDIHRLNHQLERLERKYGVMSETFYKSFIAGEEPQDDTWVLDFAKWAGLYEVWCDRNQAYQEAIQCLRLEQPSLSNLIQAVGV